MGISDKEFAAIQDAARTEVLEIDGVSYTTREVFDPRRKDPEQSALFVAGLTGICEYLVADAPEGALVHVAGPDRVEVVSRPFGRFRQRHGFVVAKLAETPPIAYGNYYSVDEFIVALQARFVDQGDRATVLKVVGTIKEEDVRQTDDDGITQTVSARTGIARVGEAKVPNPVSLAPFRTFREVDQPESDFILRLKKGPLCALFEADGGSWKLDAVAKIKAWLHAQIGEQYPIIG